MKKSLLTILYLVILFSFFLSSQIFSQAPAWKYISEVKFPPADSNIVQPYLCTVDANERLWVISSKATNSKAHNAIYYADSTDTQLKKFIDFDNNGDSDTLLGNIGALRGIGTIGSDIIVNANIPYQRTSPNTVSSMYVYKNRDTLSVEKFGFNINGAGYGTYIHGVAISKDTIVFSSTTALASGPGPAPRLYNFSFARTTPARGSWISATYQVEPGGTHSGGFDVIRDLALIPGGNYNNPEVPFYTSRNSASSVNTTGGIAIYAGGTQNDPGNYSGTRVSDASNELAFGTAIPYGITVDKNGKLWVAGIDSTRRWVKAYSILINFADPYASLPSLNDPINPDPQGAPFNNPNDVALTSDALTAYVTDGGTKTVYKFKFTTGTGINDKIELNDFQLNQNYPNPFNPSTLISYTLQKGADIKLSIANTLGEEVALISEGYHEAGKHVKEFKANNLSSGIYYYTLITEAGRISKKMMLIK
jgi:hypothetical protein